MRRISLHIDSLAHGGAGVGRHQGQVAFCPGGVPGDTVDARVTADRGRFLEVAVEALEVVSPLRVDPSCPVFGRCGGCDWQMIDLAGQRAAKADIVRSQLRHLGGIDDPPVDDTLGVGPGFRYRNRIDLRVSEGRPALFEVGSHRPVAVEDCPLVVEPIGERIARLDPGPEVDRVTIRASIATGEVVEMPRRRGRWEQGRLHEIVAGRRFQVTDRAFFQVNTAGAAALVELVSRLAVGAGEILLDGYAGGGLFAATVGARAGRVVAVESDRRAVEDLRANVPGAEIVARPFESFAPPRVDVAVVDPPRSGLGRAGVDTVVAARPGRLAYVSCDPASLARDLRMLVERGFRLETVTPVDMFPQTHHVEAVALLVR